MLGIGIGWRPEIDLTVERLPGVDFVEVIAERLRPGALPKSLRLLRSRGVCVVPHGVGLGLGGAQPPDPARLAHLAVCADLLDAPLVSEHIAMVRAGGVEVGHLLPVPFTRDSLDVLVANVRIAQAALPVPLALENVAALFAWPGDELTEGEFLAELVSRTGVHLLVDVANLHTNRLNQSADPLQTLTALPLDAMAYVHVAGGYSQDGLWHDTHTRTPSEDVYGLLGDLCALIQPPGVMLEWDGEYPSDAVLADTLARIRDVVDTRPAPTGLRQARSRPPVPSGPALPAHVDAARTRLAKRYAELVGALVLAGPPPSGFDPDRLQIQATRLAARRHRFAHQH